MPKNKKSNKKDIKDNKYNAENEIIIGVTTKPKQKVRVDRKKTTRTNKKTTKTKVNTNKKSTSNKNNMLNKNINNIKKDVVKEKQIKKLNRKKVLISSLFLALIIIGGTIYYLTTPIFNVASIKIYGNNKNSIDTYISLSEININETNIFGFTKSSIQNKLKQDSYVEDVKIKRNLPNEIEIYITERTVDYQIEYLGTYIYLNNQGYILEINSEPKDVLYIEGLSSINDNIKIGQRLSNEDLIKLDTILKVSNYIKYNSIERELTKVDVTDISNYTLEFAKEKKIVYIGDSSSITEKMTTVAKILEAEEGKEGKIYANEEVLKKNRVYFSEEKIEWEE